MNYRSDIDGLRTVAVSLVLLFHAHLGVSGGFIGVDVFFVISGFLITRTISDAHERGGFSIVVFYDHRARRILPALTPLLILTTAAALILMLPTDLLEYGKSLAATALFSSNIQFWRASGYFDTTSATNPLLHTWSLGVEEQFYIFFPLLMMLLFRTGLRNRVLVIAALALASFVLSCITLDRYPDFTFYLLPTRAWELLVGSLLSFREIPRPRPLVAQLCGLVGLASIFISVFTLEETSPFPGLSAAPSVFGAALILYAGTSNAATLVGRLLSTPPFRFIGLRSYSLYLWHWPILAFYTYVTNRAASGLVGAGLLLVALVLASLSYRFVEQPWRRRRPETPVARAPLIGLTAMAGVFVFGAALFFGHGFPQRLPDEVRVIEARAESKPPRDCIIGKAADIDDQHLCRIGDSAAEPHWVFWGDSHGWAMQASFSLWLAKRHAAAWVITSPGCPASAGIGHVGYSTDCRAVGDAALNFALNHPVSDVILISAWTNWFSLHDDFVDDQSKVRSKAESTAVVTRGFSRTVSRLHDAGVHVWVVDPLPQAKSKVPQTIAKNMLFGGSRPLAYTIEDYYRRNRDFFSALTANRSNICGRLELERTLCASGQCAVENEAGPLYFDNNHPADFQAGYFAALLDSGVTQACQ
jgi:peptidoglycan/LPS O-acetylase OafA/YrhL